MLKFLNLRYAADALAKGITLNLGEIWEYSRILKPYHYRKEVKYIFMYDLKNE